MQYDDDIQQSLAPNDAWALDQPEPTNLIAVWPHGEMPLLDQVVAAFERFFGDQVQVLDELDTDAPEIQWTAAVKLPASSGLTLPVMLWVEPLRQGMEHPPSAAGCAWVIGVETMLDHGDPLASHHNLIRALAGALPNVPAILDINTTIWHERPRLLRSYVQQVDIEPSADGLWVIHAVQQKAHVDQSVVWLHTHGLWRCGLPELEMLEVPTADMRAAGMLINDIAEMLLELGPAQPGETYEIGVDLAVAFQPWQDVASFLSEGIPGNMTDREGQHNIAHTGVRAVICDPEPVGQYRKLWTWPRSVIGRLQSGDAALYMTARASKRQAQLAQRRWDELSRAFQEADGHSSEAEFLIKASFDCHESDDDEPRREHLWFQIRSMQGDRADGVLLNDPIHAGIKRGDRVTVGRDQVSDWQVRTAAGLFTPESGTTIAFTANG